MEECNTVKQDMTNKTNEKKVSVNKITVKISSLWFFVEWYLALLENTGAIKDEEFCRYFKQLLNYVYSKIAIPSENDIISEYVVYELKP